MSISLRHQQKIDQLRAAVPPRPPGFSDDPNAPPVTGDAGADTPPAVASSAPTNASTLSPTPSPATPTPSTVTPPTLSTGTQSPQTAAPDDSQERIAKYEAQLADLTRQLELSETRAQTLSTAQKQSEEEKDQKLKETSAEIERLRAIEKEHEASRRAAALQVTAEEAALIGGEEAMGVVRKLINAAITQTREDVMKDMGSLVEGRFSKVGEIAQQEWGRLSAEDQAKANKTKFTNAVYKVAPDWNTLASNPKFATFLDEDYYGRRVVVNDIFSKKDTSDAAMRTISSIVAAFSSGDGSKPSFEAPANTAKGAQTESSPDLGGDKPFDAVAYQNALRRGDFNLAKSMKTNLSKGLT
jgi:hypothetical protein